MSVKSIAFAIVALAVVAALWFYFKPPSSSSASAQPGTSSSAVVSNPATPAAAGMPGLAPPGPGAGIDVFELVIRNGKLASGPSLMQVHEGEQVLLRIRSDGSDELHLHGYDLHARISPQETASLQFTAIHSGRFGLELHKAHTELGALEVYPR